MPRTAPHQRIIGPKCPSRRLRNPVARMKAQGSALTSPLQGAFPDQPSPSHAPSVLSSWDVSPLPKVIASAYSVARVVPYGGAGGPCSLLAARHAEQHLAGCGLLHNNMSHACFIKESGLNCPNTRRSAVRPSSSGCPVCVSASSSLPVQSQPLLAASCAAFGKRLKLPGPQFLHL